MGFFSEEILHDLNDLRHPGHATDQHDLLDIFSGYVRVGQGFAARLDRTLNQVVYLLFKLCPCELDHHVLRTTGVGGDKGQIDLGFLG